MAPRRPRVDQLVGIEDRRLLPIQIVQDDIDALADEFTGRELQVARSLYLAIVELCYSTPVAEPVEATRREVADRAGMTTRPLDRYVERMERIRLVFVTRRRDSGGGNLPNLWSLGNPSAVGGEAEDTRAAGDGVGASASSPKQKTLDGREEGVRGRGEGTLVERLEAAIAASFGENLAAAPAELTDDARALLERKARVGGRQVTLEEMIAAMAGLAEFNRQLGSDYGLGANVDQIVSRLRERPSMDPLKHVRLVQSAFRLKWWEQRGNRRRPSPNVIWGNPRVFEQVVQDAVEEARGKKTAGGSGRFERRKASERES